MTPIKRLFRRAPIVRWCALQHVRRIRQKQSDASWAYVQSVLSSVGNITIAWAGIELMLSHLILWHIKKVGVLPKRGLPRMLKYQLDYVKSAIETDISIDNLVRAQISDIRKRIADLNAFRINIIHGVLHQRNRRTMKWHTQSIKIGESSAIVVNVDYSNEDIQQRNREISELARVMSPFIADIIGMTHHKSLK